MKHLIIIFLFLVGCSAEWHVKRAVQIDSSILEKDTIRFTDSIKVITEKVTHDSVFQVSKDTVIIQKDKLTIKHYYHNDSVYLWGECESDTITRWKKYEVPVEKVVIQDPLFPRWLIWVGDRDWETKGLE